MLSYLPIILLAPFASASPISPQAANAGAAQPFAAAAVGKPSSEGVTTFDGVALASIQERPAPQAEAAGAIDRAGWTCTVDSAQAGSPCENVLDGDANTIWQSEYDPPAHLPQSITIDMKQSYLVGSIAYQPRQDGNGNGNIGQHIISLR